MNYIETLKFLKENAPLFAVTVALLALFVAIINSIISKKALKINSNQYQNKLSNFDCYLIDNYSLKIEDERILLFHVTLSNKSESKNSFYASLHIEYLNENNTSTILKIKNDPAFAVNIKKRNFTFFPKDIFLNDKESQSKWLVFAYKHQMTKGKRIENYEISIKDVNSNIKTFNSMIMKDLIE